MPRKTSEIVADLREQSNYYEMRVSPELLIEAADRLEKSISIDSDVVRKQWGSDCVEGAEWLRDAIEDGSIDEMVK